MKTEELDVEGGHQDRFDAKLIMSDTRPATVRERKGDFDRLCVAV